MQPKLRLSRPTKTLVKDPHYGQSHQVRITGERGEGTVSYTLPVIERAKSGFTVGVGSIESRPTGKGLGKEMLQLFHEVVQEHANRTKEAVIHNPYPRDVGSRTFFMKQGYAPVNNSGVGGKWTRTFKPNGKPKELSRYQEDWLRLLAGEHYVPPPHARRA